MHEENDSPVWQGRSPSGYYLAAYLALTCVLLLAAGILLYRQGEQRVSTSFRVPRMPPVLK